MQLENKKLKQDRSEVVSTQRRNCRAASRLVHPCQYCMTMNKLLPVKKSV